MDDEKLVLGGLPGCYPLPWGCKPATPPRWVRPGQRVVFMAIRGQVESERETRITSQPWQLGDGTWVVHCEGVRCAAIFALRPIEEEQPMLPGVK